MSEHQKNALGPKAIAALQSLLSRRALLAFDFDGTLAPIMAHPDQVRLSASLTRCLTLLQEQHVVAIITGRSVGDVRGRLNFTPDAIIGSHGAEDPDEPDQQRHVLALEGVRQALSPEILANWHAQGIFVEDKGFSLAFHFRRALDRDQARSSVLLFVKPWCTALKLFEGKMVVNLTDGLAPDKADAVNALARKWGLCSVLYLGDDVNDEPVFERRQADWFTVRVGALLAPTAAEYLLSHQSDVAVFLNVCRRLSSVPPRRLVEDAS